MHPWSILNFVIDNFEVLDVDTSLVCTILSLLKPWKQSFDLHDGNHVASRSG